MTEIYCMTQIHKYWNETICLAEKCSWKAGPYLAQKMKSNDFNTWERVFVACVNEYPFTPFIGFVFVDEPYRGNRLSELMIQSAILYARELGYEKVYILSGEIGLYEKYGFEKLGDYKTIFGSIDQLFVKSTI